MFEIQQNYIFYYFTNYGQKDRVLMILLSKNFYSEKYLKAFPMLLEEYLPRKQS